MLSNYLKVALRTLAKNKLHTIINVLGLALGIACVMLISFYVRYETGYDKYYDGYENVYRVNWEDEDPQTRTPHPMAQALVTDFPEVDAAVTLSPLWGPGLTRATYSIKNPANDKRFEVLDILAVDSTFFDVFPLSVTKGNGIKALRTTNGVLISESVSKKYFGDEDPIGKQLIVYPDSAYLEVMAVFQDVPDQSHIKFNFLISYVREKSFDPEDEYFSWSDFGHYNYVRLKPGVDAKALEKKLLPWIRKYIDVSDEFFAKAVQNNNGFRLQPVTEIHLKSHLRWELEPNGNIEYVYIMAVAALFTLVIACINFMNLMTARSAERAKEIGVRKTIGANRKQLSFQFLSESVLTSLAAVTLSLFLVEGILPFYKNFTGQQFSLNYGEIFPVLLAAGLVIGLLAGLYPAFALADTPVQRIVKGKFQTSATGTRLRSVLITTQFSVSMMLISGALIIYNQLDFIQSKTLGFNKDETLVVPLKGENISKRLEALKTELKQVAGVSAVSASSNMPGGNFNQNTISLTDHPENEITCAELFADHDFIVTMDIDLAAGQFFQQRNPGDKSIHFVLNETAARQLGGGDLVGKELNWHLYEEDAPLRGRVAGVVKDFHFQSFHDPLRPLVIVNVPAYNHLVLKVNTESFDATIGKVKTIYQQFGPGFDFEFTFLEERLARQYEVEQRTALVFSIFACIAIAIACFGLFAMAMLSFAQRTKEVSVRKVFGASVPALIVLLLRDFTRLIVISIVIAIPAVWWGMDRWLDNFVYQVDISPMVFLVSGAALLMISWLTLTYLTYRTSQLNPASTLKAE